MGKALSIGLDLGGDTIKIAFAIEEDDFEISYGKFAETSELTQIAIPSIAFYNTDEKKWYYGNQISKQSESYLTVVKIKNLISLLARPKCEEKTADGKVWDIDRVWTYNKNYYYNEHYFPKFFFPARRKMLNNFDDMVNRDMTFICKEYTPQEVCSEFFGYIKDLVDERCKKLNKLKKENYDSYKITIVHPSSVGKEYINELSYLITDAFGCKPSYTLNSTKALSIYALERGVIEEGENFLVFDMGEEFISVMRAEFLNGQVAVDGVEGHNPPLELGGIDVDQAIVNYIYNSVGKRETIGSPSADKEGHIFESGAYGKQYLLMKDVKKAKVILSKPLREDSLFNQGVPIELSWDLHIQRRFTKEDFRKSLGFYEEDGVAQKIYNYIKEEVERPINHDIEKVIISGGLTETYFLLDYINEKLAEDGINVEVITFDDYCYKGDDFKILSFEDSVFAPAVGGAIVALKDIAIKMILSLSYATYIYTENKKCLSIFAERGEIIDGGREFVEEYMVSGWGTTDEELFSTHITTEDIEENFGKNWQYTKNGWLVIGEEGSQERLRAERDYSLRTVSGGKDSKIIFIHKGKQCKVLNDENIEFEEGISVDANGVATPIIRNVSVEDRWVEVSYIDNLTATKHVKASEIQLKLVGLEDVDTNTI